MITFNISSTIPRGVADNIDLLLRGYLADFAPGVLTNADDWVVEIRAAEGEWHLTADISNNPFYPFVLGALKDELSMLVPARCPGIDGCEYCGGFVCLNPMGAVYSNFVPLQDLTPASSQVCPGLENCSDCSWSTRCLKYPGAEKNETEAPTDSRLSPAPPRHAFPSRRQPPQKSLRKQRPAPRGHRGH
jgi:hypothetical protein